MAGDKVMDNKGKSTHFFNSIFIKGHTTSNSREEFIGIVKIRNTSFCNFNLINRKGSFLSNSSKNWNLKEKQDKFHSKKTLWGIPLPYDGGFSLCWADNWLNLFLHPIWVSRLFLSFSWFWYCPTLLQSQTLYQQPRGRAMTWSLSELTLKSFSRLAKDWLNCIWVQWTGHYIHSLGLLLFNGELNES